MTGDGCSIAGGRAAGMGWVKPRVRGKAKNGPTHGLRVQARRNSVCRARPSWRVPFQGSRGREPAWSFCQEDSTTSGGARARPVLEEARALP